MSSFVHMLIIGGLFVVVFGIWFTWRRYSPVLDKRRPGAKAIGDAILSLGTLALLAPLMRTDVSIDAWSAQEKVIGAGLLAILLYVGIQFGTALTTLRQRKSSAGKA